MLRILDVGCGPGIYVKALHEAGAQATGVDLDINCPYDQCDVFSHEFESYFGKYDICLCLEVAEHLEESKAGYFVDRLTKVAPTVVFSAAQPGQGGLGHINCQTREYWEHKFATCNYVLDPKATDDLVAFMRQGYHMGWLVNNVMVFRTYGSMYYKQIVEEETPQAVRLAEYLTTQFVVSSPAPTKS